MNVMGVDPGPTDYSAVWWDGETAQAVVLATIDGLVRHAGESACLVAIEDFVIYRPLSAESRETIKQIGAIRYECQRQGVECVEIPRAEVLRHHAGATKGGDTALRAALIDRFGGSRRAVWGVKAAPGPLYGITGSHLLAALGVALTAWDRAANA